MSVQCLKCTNQHFVLFSSIKRYPFLNADLTDVHVTSYSLVMTHTFTGACARTHTHTVTISLFPSPLLGESDEARSNANWVKCSGKWLFPMGLLNSSSELALSRCVFVCVCQPHFLLLHSWVCESKLFCMRLCA